jgi:hypothetical protein
MSMSTKQTRTRGEDYVAPVPVPKIKRTRGRPSEFDEAYLPEAVEYAKQGMTDVQIAEAMGVEVRTLYRWYAAYPQLRQAVKGAQDIQDDQVELSLLHQAKTGNTTAQIFWLKNRRPNEWRDRKETEIIVPEPQDVGEVRDARGAALAALALFNEAQYDPGATGMLLEATANAEESADGEQTGIRRAESDGTPHAVGEDFADGARHVEGDDDWGDEPAGYDIDPGEL